MTLTELRYIVAVARERHFGRASDSCFVSQPTLSLGVKKLEQEFGITLFERGRHEVVITAEGQRIIDQAQRILEEASALKRLTKELMDPLEGVLRLGAIYTVGPYLLPELLPAVKQRAPKMTLILEENYTEVLTQHLRSGAVDVAILSLPYSEPGIEVVPLYDEPFVILLPAGHPLARLDGISAELLSRETVLLLGKGHCFRDQVLAFCPQCKRTAADDDLQRALEGGSLETIRYMVAGGAGVTVLPCTAATGRYSKRLYRIGRFAGIQPMRSVALAWRSSFTRRPAIDMIRDAILACNRRCTERPD